MIKIGLISDTHGFLDDQVFSHFANCDEIWHAGDFGTHELADRLSGFKRFRGVYGNIDGPGINDVYPPDLVFHCEKVKVLMTHIGGYPPLYNPRARALLDEHRPQLFICGHSHILKIIFDKKRKCLHINPGAAGRQGWHKTRTLVRLTIHENDMRDCEVIELGSRG